MLMYRSKWQWIEWSLGRWLYDQNQYNLMNDLCFNLIGVTGISVLGIKFLIKVYRQTILHLSVINFDYTYAYWISRSTTLHLMWLNITCLGCVYVWILFLVWVEIYMGERWKLYRGSFPERVREIEMSTPGPEVAAFESGERWMDQVQCCINCPLVSLYCISLFCNTSYIPGHL